MKTLNIIGAGRVGRSLAHLWQGRGVFKIQHVLTTSAASAKEAVQFIGAGRAVHAMGDMRPAAVWMLAVPDGQIEATAVELSNTKSAGVFVASDAIVFHCSGALASTLMGRLQSLGCHLASAHCILSFSSPTTAVEQFAGTPCALEGDPLAVQSLQAAFTVIDAQPFALAAENKVLYHAAAVFATNFLPVLQVVAADLWRSTGMPQDMIAPLSARLLNNALQNITIQGAAQALTGPAARGDTELVIIQGKVVAEWNAQAGIAYDALSLLAAQIAKHGTIKHDT